MKKTYFFLREGCGEGAWLTRTRARVVPSFMHDERDGNAASSCSIEQRMYVVSTLKIAGGGERRIGRWQLSPPFLLLSYYVCTYV